jgi:putative acetyltransferase
MAGTLGRAVAGGMTRSDHRQGGDIGLAGAAYQPPHYAVAVHVRPDDPTAPDVTALLDEHLADMHDTSPPESVHALGHAALADSTITFVTAREDGELLGCGALKQLTADHAEIKSMRTAGAARGRGVATAVLGWLLADARDRGLARVSLETGTQDYFAAAHRLYLRHGFVDCEPFGDYVLDPNSRFLTLALD